MWNCNQKSDVFDDLRLLIMISNCVCLELCLLDRLLSESEFAQLVGGGEAVFTRVNTTPAKILNCGELESPSVLERSKTDGQRLYNILPEEAARIYDNQISVQEKVVNILSNLYHIGQ